LFYYFFTGLGAALLYSLVAYWEVGTGLAAINSFVENPTLSTLQSLIDARGTNLNAQYLLALQDVVSNGGIAELPGIAKTLSGFQEKLINNLPPVVGASGAVYGLLLAYGMLFPEQELLIYFVLPVKAKYLVILLAIFALYMGIENNPGDNVAHFAHLGGMLFGLPLILYWHKK